MIFIDTEIWVFSRKSPDRKQFLDASKYKLFLDFHNKSVEFLVKAIENNIICMTYHQLLEIYHSLAFRGRKEIAQEASKFCAELLSSKFIHWYSITESQISECLKLSAQSNIHVWDYICIFPLINNVDVLYSCDSHFQDATFSQFKKPILNPLDKWILI
jgi:predicted nucleic acid-binding protein